MGPGLGKKGLPLTGRWYQCSWARAQETFTQLCPGLRLSGQCLLQSGRVRYMCHHLSEKFSLGMTRGKAVARGQF